MRVGTYVKINDDGGREYWEACNIPKVLDRDHCLFHLGLGLKLTVGSICLSKLDCLFILTPICVGWIPIRLTGLLCVLGLMSKLMMMVDVNIVRHVTFLRF
jgi:hypothetical protein